MQIYNNKLYYIFIKTNMVYTPCEYHMGDELMKQHVYYMVGSNSNGSPLCVFYLTLFILLYCFIYEINKL